MSLGLTWHTTGLLKLLDNVDSNRNGYFYHTALDNEAALPDGSIQHMGHTMLEIARAVSNSDTLQQEEKVRNHENQYLTITGYYPNLFRFCRNLDGYLFSLYCIYFEFSIYSFCSACYHRN